VFANRLEIGGRILENSGLRHTPAGLPSLQLKLAHVSQQREAGREREVSCEVEALAFGEIAAALARVETGSLLNLTGFVERRALRSSQLTLHVIGYELIKES
jgi:primosomal replication protein N